MRGNGAFYLDRGQAETYILYVDVINGTLVPGGAHGGGQGKRFIFPFEREAGSRERTALQA